MTKRKRLIIVLACALLFLIVVPYIIFYSLGYRIDFESGKIWATGGIYVRAFPQPVNVIVDYKIENSTSLFANSVFVQNLSPTNHTVLIRKDGYYDYQKNLKVEEKQVTKLENVTLFRKDYVYRLIANDADYFSIAPNNITLLKAVTGSQKIDFEIIDLEDSIVQELSLSVKNGVISDMKWSDDSNKGLLKINNSYFLMDLSDPGNLTITQPFYLSQSKDANFNPQNPDQIFFIKNKNIYLSSQSTPVLKNVASYKIVNQDILYLSYDGFLYRSDISGQASEKITSKALEVKTTNSYSIVDGSDRILIKENDSLLLVNEETKVAEILHSPVKNIKLSPNHQRILYFDENEVSYYGLSINLDNERINIKISDFDNIKDCQWLNDDYIICSLANKIIISEIDNRGNVNVLNLAEKITLDSGTIIEMKDSKIFFNQRDKRIYILTGRNLLYSDKILP